VLVRVEVVVAVLRLQHQHQTLQAPEGVVEQ
jgi:hypothetical protein